MIVPVIEGWGFDKHLVDPAGLNVKLNSPFCPKLPELNTPEGVPGIPLVTVCVELSLLIHLIVVPAGIVLLAGENAKPLMNISFAPGVPVLPLLFVE